MSDQFKTLDFPAITREQIRDYSECSGDDNPIHLDQEFAKAAGLPDVIAHGMLTMGLAATCLERWGLDITKLKSFESKFKDKVFVGESLQARCEKSQRHDSGELEISWKMLKDEESEVLSAQAIFAP